ncbi:phosphate acetyltransferase [Polymorphum gilvum]|uniref:MaoC-like dehydratase, putative n=1 Tax=Polymorphum gilvum (strain LMG 25793 / CGMCC 1.9160 / SL003B-26A1) TaxID=991905 RepID=F2J124_POLGS|nr:phosphate acetyltransferase [Polymorphum gilvum]ADZ71970.1 MaoC-like dehydratase, putative [Polymorphum gilvum SL003B-26A1]
MSFETGQSAETTRIFGADDIAVFDALSGGPAVAPGTVPGPLIGALFSYLLGVELPGPGTNYLKQDMRFLAPAPLGVPLTARVTITRLRSEKHLVDLETVCETADGTRLCEGRALVYVEDAVKRL